MTAWLFRLFTEFRSHLDFRQIKGTTDSDRGRDRQRRALLSVVAAMGAKVISVGTQLITVPLTLNYLGAERFGMWMTMSSVIAMLAFADLGIGNGLLNAISEANGKDDSAAIRRYISSATVILVLISSAVLAGFALIYSFVPWARFFNVHTSLAAAESGPAAATFVICFALNITATIVQRVQMGLQMGFVANLWQAAGSVLALVAVLTVVHLRGGLHWLVFAFAGAPVIGAAMNAASFFGRFRRDLLPRISLVTRESGFRVMRMGVLFLILQIVAAMIYASDNVIIAHVLGASAVTIYAVPDKLFSVIPMILSMMLMPLWPAYTEAMSRGDGAWVRKILKKTLLVSFVFSLTMSIFFVAFGQAIIMLWVGHPVDIPILLLASFGVWKVLEAIGNALAVFLNAANIIGIQIVISSLTALSAVALKFYLIHALGVSGVIVATIVCFSIVALLPYSFLIKQLVISRTNGMAHAK